MVRRFVSIWFRQLKTDWFVIRQPSLSTVPFVLSIPSHGRMIITAANHIAQSLGANTGMLLADARAIVPGLQSLDDIPDMPGRLLKRIAEYCIRFTPIVSIDLPDGLILDVTGCTHIWGSDYFYLSDITKRLKARGYQIKAAMADTIGVAWAIARYSQESMIIDSGMNTEAILPLPVESLRLETDTIQRLQKLGLHKINHFIHMPRTVLKRRFGEAFIKRLNEALGLVEETVQPVQPVIIYQERLPCLEPIVTAKGIEIAIQRLLNSLCHRLMKDGIGLRIAILKCYCTDGKIKSIEIRTNRASHNEVHLYKLFEIKISQIDPGLGIELFILEATLVEPVNPFQEKLWKTESGLEDVKLSELLDRLEGKIGRGHIHRYLPEEHYWPERSFKLASSLYETSTNTWRVDRSRPLQVLLQPEHIDVTAPVPDYPPMLFRYNGTLHKIIKADGPERIEQEWWIQEGEYRDYYCVEDEKGCRYWLFRSGHYSSEKINQWFIHGFFA